MKSFESAKRFILPGMTAALGFAAVHYRNSNKELRTSERELIEENRFRQMRSEADAKRIVTLKSESAANAKVAKAMEGLAMLDPLTTLYNRRAIQDSFDRLQASRLRGNDPGQCTLIILDLDNLKSINDNESAGGHAAGDKALIQLADAMSNRVRKEDMVARIGGDEFAILLQHAPLDSAPLVAAGVKNALDRSDSGLTFSGGIAEFGPDETFEECYLRADAALYEAKRLGRGRVELAA